MDKKRVLVGMSGGIDSTATCLMLQEQGYEVVGVTMRTWDVPSKFSAPGQALPDDVLEARQLAERLEIPYYIADVREDFREVVVQNFVDEYLNGRTPNPCVLCNPLFKFRVLTEWADKMDCEYIATGHYTLLEERGGFRYIVAGEDEKKDQSYFLWRVGQEVLRRCIFPLGSYTKEEVRAYLKEKGFEAKSKEGESMEVCFVEGDYRDFLRQQVPDLDERIGPGKFVNEEGIVLGTHKGFPYYTIGQRKGLEIALGYPAYVLKLNPQKNTVMLGTPDKLRTEYMLIEAPQWVDEQHFRDEEPLTVRIRYRSKPIPCEVYKLGQEAAEGKWLVRFLTEASSVTPGQSAVFYVGKRVIGGALIASQRGIGMFISAADASNPREKTDN